MTDKELGLRLGWHSIPNSASRRLAFSCGAQSSPFLRASGCLIIVSSNRWNRLSPLSHYCMWKEQSSDELTPPNLDCVLMTGKMVVSVWLSVLLSADLDLSVNFLWDSWNVSSMCVSHIVLPTRTAQVKRADQNGTRTLKVSKNLAGIGTTCHQNFPGQCGASTRCTKDALTTMLWKCSLIWLNWEVTTWELSENAHSSNSQWRKRFKKILSHSTLTHERFYNLVFWYLFRVVTGIGRLVKNDRQGTRA